MSLIVEDGTGREDAESFCTVAFATAYHNKRNNTTWEGLDLEVQESLLRLASDYMEQVYSQRWAGIRKVGTQALSWPRDNVEIRDAWPLQYYANDSVPTIVQNACAELALKANAGELAPDVTRVKKRVKTDVLEVEYADSTTPYTRYRAIDNMLERFFGVGGANISIVRA